MDVGRIDAVFLLEDAAHPDVRGLLVFRQADELALEIGRAADVAVSPDVDRRMPEMSRHERRNRDVGTKAARRRHQVAVERQLGDVEVVIAERPEKQLLGIERQIGDLAPVDLHAAVLDRTGAVVFGAGNCQRDVAGT